MPGESVSLKEHFEAQLRCLKELLDVQSEAIGNALGLQRDEYARRLGELNHAHEEARRILATYLPREAYESRHKELEGMIRGLDEKVRDMSADLVTAKALADEKLASTTRNFTRLTIIAGIVVSIVAVVSAGILGILTLVMKK